MGKVVHYQSSIGGVHRARSAREAAQKVLRACARLMRAQVTRLPVRDSLGYWSGECFGPHGASVHSFKLDVVPAPSRATWERSGWARGRKAVKP